MQIPSHSLAGRVAVVSGAAQGIGKGIALGLAAYGADVALVDRDAAGADATAAEIRALGRRALALHGDCRERATWRALAERTKSELGPAQVLVNNVGGNVGRVDFLDSTEEQWHAALQQNLFPALYGIHTFVPEMIARGIRGSVINVSTIEAFRAAPGYAVYAASKAGVVNLTKTLALELGDRGIRVNGIAPDITPTPRIQLGDPSQIERMGRSFPLARFGKPEDYVGTALYLASDLSAWITGETLQVGGGTLAAAGWLRDAKGHWLQNFPA
jgi:NAD(P)-dependent dehydrogenase (short-subunit alcohol dehydrogenase family)